MLNTFSLICLNSALSFFFAKLPEAYAFLSPIVDFMPVIPLFFSLSLCLASCCKFSMRSFILS